jgi:hypothetical protein
MNIYKQIKKEIDDFHNDEVVIVDNYHFNQKRVVDQNVRLYNSVFSGGEWDSEGYRKYFDNIVRNPSMVAEKAISFRPADVQLTPAPGQAHPATGLRPAAPGTG